MAVSAKLAELYVELTTRGQADTYISGMVDKLKHLKAGLSASTADYQVMINMDERLARGKAELLKKMDVAQYGRFGSAMRDLGGHVKTVVDQVNQSAASFAIMGAALTGTVAAASPQIFQTFTGSFQLLAASIGEMAAPAILKVIELVQRLAFWVQSLDPDTKNQIASWLTWGVVLGGSVIVLAKITSAVWSLIAALKVLAIATSPLAALSMLALGAGVTYLASSDISNAVGGQGAARREAARAAPISGSVEDRRHARNEGIANQNNNARLIADAEAATARERAAQAEVDAARVRQREIHARAFAPGMRGAEQDRLFAEHRGAAQELHAAEGRHREAGQNARRANDLAGPARAGAAGRPGITPGDSFQSQFFGIEQQWRRLQQAGSSQNPLEQERMEIMRRMRDVLNDHVAGTNQEGNMGRIAANTVPREGGPLS